MNSFNKCITVRAAVFLLCAQLECFSSEQNEKASIVGAKNISSYISSAAFWIHPGLSRDAVVKFIGAPHLKEPNKSIYYYKFLIPPKKQNDEEINGLTKIFFDKKGIVQNVKVFHLKEVQRSSNFHRQGGKTRNTQP